MTAPPRFSPGSTGSLRLVGVSRDYGRLRALTDVSLECRAGEIVGILGPNGAGKSTLLALLATLARPSAGRIEYGDGRAPESADARARVRRDLGVLGHELCLYPELTARENLRFFARLYVATDVEARVEAALRAARLEGRADDPVSGFSRGMRQRLGFERAVIHEPRFLLLDEPFTGLDDFSADRLVERLRALRAAGVGVVVATHDLELVDGVIDRAGILRAGRATVVDARGTALRALYARVVRNESASSTFRLRDSRFGGQAAPSTPAPSTPAPSTPAPSTPAPSAPAPSAPTATFARVVWQILRKDLLIETRNREVVATTLFFAVACVLVFSFGFVEEGRPVREAVGGILWIAVAFSGTLALGHVFERERSNATLQGLLLAPVSRAAVYLGKLGGILALMAAVELVVVPLVVLFFQVRDIAQPLLLVALLAAGTVGFAAVGALFAAMLTRATSREVLLPILLYPMTVPVLIAGVRGTLSLLDPSHDDAMAVTWLAMLIFFDTVFLTLALWTFEALMTE
ncbi:MAG: ATP-binding cassette domain-containing protein [Luteitalea sp.]|nr:ATP-binding cassette domain-containing protein [Luteitalea sp.]